MTPPPRIDILLAGRVQYRFFYGIPSPRDHGLRYRVSAFVRGSVSSCVSASSARRERETKEKEGRRDREREREIDRVTDNRHTDHEIRAGYVATRSLAVARILTRKCGAVRRCRIAFWRLRLRRKEESFMRLESRVSSLEVEESEFERIFAGIDSVCIVHF